MTNPPLIDLVRKRRIVLKTKDGPTQVLGICPTPEPPVEIVTLDKHNVGHISVLSRVTPLAAYYEELDIETSQEEAPLGTPVMSYTT